MPSRKSALFALCAAALMVGACSDSASREAKYMKRGIAFLQQGDYDKAEIEFKNAARIKPTDPEVRYRLGQVFEGRGDLPNAFGNYSAAINQDGHYEPAQLKIAEFLIAGGQTAQAEERLHVVLADQPDNAEAHALSAAIALRERREDEADREAHFALGKEPGNKTAVAVLAGLYLLRKDSAKLTAILDQGLARNPDDLSMLQLRASAYRELKDFPRLGQAYDAIFRLRPKEIEFRQELAAIYVANDRLDDAEAVLRGGVAADPDNWEMKRLLVVFLSDHRPIETAEAEIRGYMKTAPDNDKLYFWLADLYTRHQAVDKAVALLQEVVERNKMDPPGLNARTSLAQISFARGDRTLASKLIAAVLEKSPDNQNALMLRASMAYDSGRYQGAVSDLRTVLRDNPRAIPALQLLAETLIRQNHADLAIDTLNRLLEIQPDDLDARVRLAQMYHVNGASDRALDTLALVTGTNPTYAVGWESTARIAIDLKKWPEANAAIDKLATLPDQADTAKFLSAEVANGSGNPDQALKLYGEIIAADPSTPLAGHALIDYLRVSQAVGRLPTAARFLETLKGDTPLVASMLGETYLLMGEDIKAASALDKAIASGITQPEPYLNRAALAVRAHDPNHAIAVLRQGMTSAPRDLTLPMRLAALLGSVGRNDEAIAVYEDLLSRDPTLDAAANNMASLISDFDYTDPAALERARLAAERFQGSGNPLLIDTLAWVDYRLGANPRALTLMERATSLAGANLPPQLHYHYGAMLLKAGQKDLAKVQLRLATEAPTPYPGIEDAKKMLSAL